jgi:hypothetical protein
MVGRGVVCLKVRCVGHHSSIGRRGVGAFPAPLLAVLGREIAGTSFLGCAAVVIRTY